MIKVMSEGSSTYGFGHLVRCLTLVNYCLKIAIDVQFIVDGDESSMKYVKDNQGQLINWKNDEYLQKTITKDDIVIVDSYYVTLEQLNTIKKNAKECLVIDDLNRLDYQNFAIINPNFSAETLEFDNEINTYLIGEDYILLRDDFLNKKYHYLNRDVETVLLTLGGSDILNLTPKLINYFKRKYPNVTLNVVIGFGYNNIKEIEKNKNSNTNLYHNVDALQMSQLMLKSDFVICAAGQTVNEILKLGCPACFIKVIDNQDMNIEYFNKTAMGLVFLENDFSNIDKLFDNNFRSELVECLSKIKNDKSGAQKVFEYIEKGAEK